MSKNTGKALGYLPLPAGPARPLTHERVERGRTAERGQTSATGPGRTADGKPRAAGKPIAPGPKRTAHRLVTLPDELHGVEESTAEEAAAGVPTIFEDTLQPSQAGVRGRISAWCIAEEIDRKALEIRLKDSDSTALIHSFPEVLYGRHEDNHAIEPARADVFYFDYGVVVFWNLQPERERALLESLSDVFIDPLPQREVEIDEMEFHYTASEKPRIQNDIFTINHRLAGDHITKLSISHALAQSTKLSVYESRLDEIVDETKDIPEILASTGQVKMSRKSVAQLIGRVFIQKSAVNLLSTVLDTPEFFWDAPDAMLALYKSSCSYLDYDGRIEILNARFQVIQEMLDMVRDQQNNYHTVRLEWIVIWLIVVEVIVGLFECLSILGWVGKHSD